MRGSIAISLTNNVGEESRIICRMQTPGNLFKFAHLSKEFSSTFGSHDHKLSMMNRVGNLAVEAFTVIASLQ